MRDVLTGNSTLVRFICACISFVVDTQEMAREGSGTSIWARASPATSERALPTKPKHNTKGNARKGSRNVNTQSKLSEEELQARMDRIRQQNQELLRRREEVEQDKAEFAKVAKHDQALQHQASIERKEKEARERKVMEELSVAREENARRKLAARQERAWDSEKQNGANGRSDDASPSPTSKTFNNNNNNSNSNSNNRRGNALNRKTENGWSSGSERSKSPFSSPRFPARKVHSSHGIHPTTNRIGQHNRKTKNLNDATIEALSSETASLTLDDTSDQLSDEQNTTGKEKNGRKHESKRIINASASGTSPQHDSGSSSSTKTPGSPVQEESIQSPLSEDSIKSIGNIDDLFVWPPPDSERVAWGDEEVSVLKSGAVQNEPRP
ncbi:hypothetical protein BDF22DRAFT_668890 [Syncephalis plumigaleata]|nr:hypothetical protein BDF22DRAFT_668890 [Syncephalis plumigaleata]